MTKIAGQVQSISSIQNDDEVFNRFQQQLIASLRPILSNPVLSMADWRICEDEHGQLLIQHRIGVNRWQTAWEIGAVPLQVSNTTNNVTNTYFTNTNNPQGGFGWKPLTLLNGWTDGRNSAALFASEFASLNPLLFPEPGYTIDATGTRVYMRGIIVSPATAVVPSPIAFTLPRGWRPSYQTILAIDIPTLDGHLVINTNGDVWDDSTGYTPTQLYTLDTLSFSVL